jgi:ABC transporter substrate binding protein (PQQ-dependent alcohol dehydrogenase system)
MTDALRALSVIAALMIATAAQAATTLRIALLQRDDDERLEPRRVELAYPGHPGGTLNAAINVALTETRFELDAAKLQVTFEVASVRSADEVKARLQSLEKAGVAAVIVDLPAQWITSQATAVKMPLLNAGSADDTLRGTACQLQLFHTVPSERMAADALAQILVARRWSRVLLLHGPRADDVARLAGVQASIRRYGLKAVAVKAFKLSADPRERDLSNPLLLTGGLDYDVVWVVDTDGEFARTLPYRTTLPRPVVGDAGLTAQAWAPHFERFGAPQLARRFAKQAQRPMTGADWAAWIAAKAVLQAALEAPASPTAETIRRALTRSDFTLDGFKGVRLSFRPWDRQLRQPLLMTDGQGVIAIAPAEGVLHAKNVLDTLGADAPESACRAK